MSFIITTDSGCDLNRAKCEANQVRMISMKVTVGDEIIEDTQIDENTCSFYRMMREGKAAKSGHLNSQDCKDAWKPMLEEGLPIVHISLGSAISGSYASARYAAEEMMEEMPGAKILVVDSTAASTAYGLMTMEAVRMRDEGLSAEECVSNLENMKSHINAYYTTSDLSWLKKGGRISKSAALIGSMLHIQPIMNLSLEGNLQAVEKVRGSKAALRRIVSILRENVENPEQQTLYISHADCPETVEAYLEEIRKYVSFRAVDINYIGTLIGAHTGPGMIALFWKGKKRVPNE